MGHVADLVVTTDRTDVTTDRTEYQDERAIRD